MSWTLRKSDQAIDDLALIWNHIALDNPPAADKLVGDLIGRFDRTRDFPFISRPAEEVAAGHRVLAHRAYLLTYCVDEVRKTIELVRVVHGARDWPALFED